MSGAVGVTIPKTIKDITTEWIQETTGILPIEGSISTTENIQDGIGFLSNICRVSFRSPSGENKNILIKLLPENPIYREMTIDQAFDKREIQFYSIVKPQILELAPTLEENMCKHYCTKVKKGAGNGEDYASMLIFEDLKPLGYQMLKPESPTWKKNLTEIMKFSAKLTATGVTLEKQKSTKISEMFPFCMGAQKDEKFDLLVEFGKTNSAHLEGIFLEHDVPEDIRVLHKEVSNHVEELLTKTLQEAREFSCLIHGDIWGSNVMVNEEEPKLPIKIIDWQLLGYRDPTYELTIAILTCLPVNEINKENVDYFAKLYFSEFLANCKEYGHEYTARDEEGFMKFFNSWGMAYGYFWFILSIDCFQTDPKKLIRVFEFLHEVYGIPEFLMNEHCKFLCTS